ncbi:MAG: hypothetical protein R3301_18780, partial [Saprospiraceae bacterium]|nr:hypothetical protein [Saprospiraceae bacterium]
MHWALIPLVLLIGGASFSSANGQPVPSDPSPLQVNPEDSIAQYVMRQIRSEVRRKGHDDVIEVYKEHLAFFRLDDSLFSEAIEYFLATGRNDVAIEVLKINPFLMSQHNEQALYWYYKGVSQMLDPRGWRHFKLAEKSMNEAVVHLKRSYAPDYGFFSDVENARGYLSIVARGVSTNDEKHEVCIIRSEFIYQAIDHFREALVYNPDNEIAQANLDTLLHMLELAGLPPPA